MVLLANEEWVNLMLAFPGWGFKAPARALRVSIEIGNLGR